MMSDDIDLGIGDAQEKIKSDNLLLLTTSPTGKIKSAKLADLEITPDVPPTQLAELVGYDGVLDVSAIMDRVRFYGQRTVESALEMGKAFVVLKAVTDHGDFLKNIENLGFSYRTAHRFMQAALRVARNGGVALLARQSKNVSAFLEMVTLDDDEVQNILLLDDLDKMSASQLRNLARKLREDKDTLNTRLNTAENKVDRLLRNAVGDPNMPKETVIARAYSMTAMKTAQLKLEGLFTNFIGDAR